MVIKLLTITMLCVAIIISMRFVHLLYPIRNMLLGSKVNVYINGFFNRRVTVSHNLPGGVVILDKIMIPVHFRGRFYTVGYMDDGNKVLITHKTWMAYLAHVAEIIRKVVDTPEYDDPTIENTIDSKEDTENEE